MENRVLKLFMYAFGIVGIIVVICSLALSGNHDYFVQAKEAFVDRINEKKAELMAMSGLELMDYYTDENPEDFSEQLRIELPIGTDASAINFKTDELTRTLEISFACDDTDYFYNYPLVGKSDHVKDLNISADGQTVTMDFTLDAVCETDVRPSGHYAYVDFVPVAERYDHILVLDMGHGGKDPGTYINGIYEKEINLKIGLELKKLFDEQDDIKVYYTRTDDSAVSLTQRAELANTTGADLFLSIHNNMLDYSKVTSGTQVLYDESDTTKGFNSKAFADLCKSYLLEELQSEDRGLVKGDDIYIVRKAKMPVALVEVGFMSNPAELKNLNDENYQKRAAVALYNAVLESFMIMENQK